MVEDEKNELDTSQKPSRRGQLRLGVIHQHRKELKNYKAVQAQLADTKNSTQQISHTPLTTCSVFFFLLRRPGAVRRNSALFFWFNAKIARDDEEEQKYCSKKTIATSTSCPVVEHL